VEAITELKDRTGSSMIAIKKFMQDKLPKDKKWQNATFLKSLKDGVAAGDFVQVKNSYKLSADFKKKALKAAKDAKKEDKPNKKTPATKKKTTTKKSTTAKKSKAKKATSTKKKTVTKKKPASKTAKKTTAKKPAKKTTAKKPAAKKAAASKPKKASTKKVCATRLVVTPYCLTIENTDFFLYLSFPQTAKKD
jgi:histone H1/5